MLTRDASLLWNNLRGLICVYKPVETKVGRVRKTIINKLCEGKIMTNRNEFNTNNNNKRISFATYRFI